MVMTSLNQLTDHSVECGYTDQLTGADLLIRCQVGSTGSRKPPDWPVLEIMSYCLFVIMCSMLLL